MKPRIVICNNPDKLKEYLTQYKRTVTIECEYGNTVVEGSVLTLAHHAEGWRNNPAPCENDNLNLTDIDIIALSHLDLDTLGGIIAVLNRKNNHETFWKLAAKIDTLGAHKLLFIEHTEDDAKRVYAYWSFNDYEKVYADKSGNISDITDAVYRFIEALEEKILKMDEDIINAGQELKKNTEKLNMTSFVESMKHVIIRRSDKFCNCIYHDMELHQYKAIVALNTKFNSIVISLNDPIEGIDCAKFMQCLYGEEAGGHMGIAGTPRNKTYDDKDLFYVADMFNDYIEKILTHNNGGDIK